ncbi:MAG TPA: DUF1573 domain-containing protein [Verrucomicrobiae bacterium]|nr:DUF1573 domain-containing protein [Verrucomicrobiae bacterium]
MNFRSIFFFPAFVGLILISACAHHAANVPSKLEMNAKPVAASAPAPVVATPPVFVPDTTHEHDPMPQGILTWDSTFKTVATNVEAAQAHFVFNFTNISGGQVVILDVHPSCGCTTTEIPPRPWIIPAGAAETIPATVNIFGRAGDFVKTITVSTDKGQMVLELQINVSAAPPMKMTDAEREAAMIQARNDRQSVFRGDCATCHVKNGEGKYGQALYDADCAICHESGHRASFVPDLHNLKVPTNPDFWKTWIAHGKPGSFMPAFSENDGGPLSDMQIASLAVYLNQAIPSKVPSPQ